MLAFSWFMFVPAFLCLILILFFQQNYNDLELYERIDNNISNIRKLYIKIVIGINNKNSSTSRFPDSLLSNSDVRVCRYCLINHVHLQYKQLSQKNGSFCFLQNIPLSTIIWVSTSWTIVCQNPKNEIMNTFNSIAKAEKDKCNQEQEFHLSWYIRMRPYW